MQATVETAALRRAFGVVKRTLSRYGGLPVLHGVKLTAEGDELRLSTTNLDVHTFMHVPAQVDAGGTVVVEAKPFGEQLKGNGTVTLNGEPTGKHPLTLEKGALRVELPTQAAPEWPSEPEQGECHVAEIATDALAYVLRAASKDDARPLLTGVLFEGDDVAATDSYRLHTAKLASKVETSVIVPGEALRNVVRAAKGHDTVRLNLGEKYAWAVVDDVTVVAKLVEGEFPNWRQLISTETAKYELEAETEPLVEALTQLKPAAKRAGGDAPVKLVFRTNDGEQDELMLSVTKNDGASASLTTPVVWRGEPDGPIGLNVGFLIDLLEGAPFTILEWRDHLKPVLLRQAFSDGTEGISLLMPVRVS